MALPSFTTSNLHSAQAKLLFALGDRLKQFDAKGDPIHITPIVPFPFTRLLNRHGLTVLESRGFPLDASSPTSRPAMRFSVQGDNLCLLVQRSGAGHCSTTGNSTKAAVLTAHYG